MRKLKYKDYQTKGRKMTADNHKKSQECKSNVFTEERLWMVPQCQWRLKTVTVSELFKKCEQIL